MKKRISAFILAILMVCTLLPVTVFADSPPSGVVTQGVYVLTEGKSITVCGKKDAYSYFSFKPEESGDYYLRVGNRLGFSGDGSVYLWYDLYGEYCSVNSCFNTLTAGQTYYYAVMHYQDTVDVRIDYQKPIEKITVTKVPDAVANSIEYRPQYGDYNVAVCDGLCYTVEYEDGTERECAFSGEEDGLPGYVSLPCAKVKNGRLMVYIEVMSSMDSLAYWSDEGGYIVREITGDGKAIDEKNFPGEGLIYRLKEYDLNGDNCLNDAEIAAVDNLSIYDKASMAVLPLFKNLKKLSVMCDLEQLDISPFTLLEELDCSYNRLQTLDLSQNSALTSLDCSYNCLTQLDIRNTKLEFVYPYYVAVGNQKGSSINVLMTEQQEESFLLLDSAYKNQRVTINGGGLINPEVVSRAEASITVPKVNAVPDSAATVAECETESAVTEWYVCDTDSSDINDWTLMKAGESFEYGKYYLSKVTLTVPESYCMTVFSSATMHATVNGKRTDRNLVELYVDEHTACLGRVFGPLGRTDVYREMYDYEGEWSVNGNILTYTEPGKEPAEFCRFDIDCAENVGFYMEEFDAQQLQMILLEDGNGDQSSWIRRHEKGETSEYGNRIRLDYYIPNDLTLNWSVSPADAADVSPTMVSPVFYIEIYAPCTLTLRAQKLTTLTAENGTSVSTFGDAAYYDKLELNAEEVQGSAVNNVERDAIAANGGEVCTKIRRLRLSEKETGKNAGVLQGDTLTVNMLLPPDWLTEDIKVYHIDSRSGELTDMHTETYSYLGYTQFRTDTLGSFIVVNKNAVCDHQMSIKNAVAATCTADGYTGDTVCTRCGMTIYTGEFIPATGHKSSAWITDTGATCSKAGSKHKECTVCREKLETATIAKKAHTAVKDKAVAATCTKTGKTAGTHCSVCGTVIKKQTTVAKKAHTYKATTTKATLTKSGKTVTKCTVCGKLKSTVSIPSVKTIKLSKTSFTYNGKAQKPALTVKDSKGKTLKNGTDYTVKYSNSKSKTPGKYTVTVTLKGKYSGTKKLSYTIVPKTVTGVKVTSSAKKTVKVSFTKATGATGYEVQYSTKKTSGFKSFGKSTKTTLTNKKLTSGKTVYIRIRAYKTVGSAKLYSAWTKIKSVKVK